MTAITAQLAQWAAQLTPEQIPASVWDFARMVVADGLACGLYGSTRPWVQPVRRLMVEDGGSPQATVWGTSEKLPAASVALVNGTSLHAIEYDDVHPVAVIHVNAQTLPAVLAVAETTGASWEQVLTAAIAGYEVGCRVGLATGAPQLARGFHPSVTSGVFGAAAGAGLLLGLSAEQMTHALGLAGTQASGLMAAQKGADVKRMHAGRAAQSGVYAARLAAKGFTGIWDVLEASYGGFGHAFAGVDDFEVVLKGLGEKWHFTDITFKMYPCCGSNHTALDGYRDLCEIHPEVAEESEPQIEVYATQATVDHVGWEYTPNSGATGAQMNLSYCLSAYVRDRELTLRHFEEPLLDRADILAQTGRVRVVREPAYDELGREGRHTVRVVVRTKSGSTFEKSVHHPRGSRERPPTPKDIEQKFLELTQPVVGNAANPLWDAIHRDPGPSVDEVVSLLIPAEGGDPSDSWKRKTAGD